jgi:hypothetical protein
METDPKMTESKFGQPKQATLFVSFLQVTLDRFYEKESVFVLQDHKTRV